MIGCTTAAQGLGLNLTAAVRAAVLKYPWARGEGGGTTKFNFYTIDGEDVRDALAAHPLIEPGPVIPSRGSVHCPAPSPVRYSGTLSTYCLSC
ncbi:hypothetical protein CIK77_01690 [Microbacterium sp. JB110]|nr:hypothetical protein CIK77_01690 [Microbacterium sp. JB110]